MKKRPTLSEHQAFGAELKELRDRLLKLSVRVSNAYPKTERAGRELHASLTRMDAAKSRLEDLVIMENGEADTSVLLGCYYGRPLM